MQYLIGSRNDFAPVPTKTTSVVTEGANGLTVYSSGKSDHYPAISVDVVDATGAGDAFAAGLLWEVSNGKTLAEGVHLGLAWAATTVQMRSSMPTTLQIPQAGSTRRRSDSPPDAEADDQVGRASPED
ncbi:PfkB family carbohydrate kinase [Nonomuraea sp. NBC_00507]|uniref:carbohydrate kinase family protein n=1 Tax=Nonomuraea sp. NBC_00507 TaxID=2976002 RepID=UPI002E16BF48